MNSASLETVEHVRRTMIDIGLRYGPRVIVATIILLFGGFVSRRVSSLTSRWFIKLELEPPLRQLLGRILAVLVFLVFLTMALQNLGIELLPLFASLGVAGVGVSLAAQGVLGNLVAGLTIIFTVASEHWLRDLLLRLGSEAEVVRPAEWVGLGAAAASELLRRYERAGSDGS